MCCLGLVEVIKEDGIVVLVVFEELGFYKKLSKKFWGVIGIYGNYE